MRATHRSFGHTTVTARPVRRRGARVVGVVIVSAVLLLAAGGTAIAATPKPKHRHAVVHHKRKPVTPAKTTDPALHLTTAKVTAPAAKPPTDALTLALTAPADCSSTGLVPTADTLDRARAAAVCLINRARAGHGLRPLRVNAKLQAAAQGHASEMVAQNYFGHIGPSGSDPVSRILAAGYVSDATGLLGENIAVGASTLATPEAALKDWMAQPDHRANILDPDYTETGIGVTGAAPASLRMGADGATYVECFGAAH